MKKISVFLVSVAGICWGLIGVFSKHLSGWGFSSIQITALRCILSSGLLGAYLFIFDRKKLKIKPSDIKYFIGTGIFSILFFNICYFITVDIVSLSVAAILLYTAPSIIMLLSIPLFGEKLNTKKVTSLILSFVGCILVTGIATGTSIPPFGIITGLCSGLGYALYTIFGRFALRKYHPFTVTFYTFLVASIGSLFIFDIDGTFELFSQNHMSIIFVTALALISTLVPFLCYTKGLEAIEAGTASIIACVEPMVSTIAGITVFGEKLTIINFIGIFMIFTAIVLINLNTNQQKK